MEVTRELLSHEDKDPYTHGVLSYEKNALDVPQDEQDFAMNLIEETLMAGVSARALRHSLDSP
ncbi:hypothetical protein [Shewanella sp. 10N.286.48.A6]|uniref:hypothetical protein n=1 Tax=Shewanella sp. 10N.286.48.A6 TaxID=1880833 RepID=UPI0039A63298